MGKSKGGGGGGIQTPKIPILPDFNIYNQDVFQPLGMFGEQATAGLGSLANWAADLATGGNAQVGAGMPGTGLLSKADTQFFAPFTSGTQATGGGRIPGPFNPSGGNEGTQSFLSGTNPQLLGPFLSNVVQNLINAQGSTGFLSSLLPGLSQTASQDTAKGNQMLQQATTGSGLYPSQQAMINQAVKTQQQQVTQQLASEGLGNSTLVGSLTGQAKMSGAAAAGQLVQGNIGLAQQEQQIGLDATQISVAAQQALFNQFSSIASMSAALQSQVWTQALQGYGEMGNMLNNTVNAFGYGLRTQEDIENAAIAQANVAVNTNAQNINLANQQAQASSSMFAGLGQLLGGGGSGGGGSGGLLGGLGGILGSVGATSPITGTVGGLEVAGGATAGTGLLGSLGGALGGAGSGILSGLGSLIGLIGFF